MTILDVTNQLYVFFLQNSVFELNADFSKIIPSSERTDIDKALILKALEELEQTNIVKRLQYAPVNGFTDPDNVNFWALSKPLYFIDQNVTISAHLSVLIASILNHFATDLDNPELQCNVMNISAKDIAGLVEILSLFMENNKEENDDDNLTEEENE